MQTTEVTQAQWVAVMGERKWVGKKNVREGNNYPAVYVSWEDCNAFIQKLNRKEGANKYRLPTEAEWEYACRAGSSEIYSFGSDKSQLDNYGWFKGNAWDEGEKYAHPVAQKKPNEWGLYDMHGNVYEWCQDWYADYPSGSFEDPKGPSKGTRRIIRGGSWNFYSWGCRSSYRDFSAPSAANSHLGFRLCLSE